MHVRGDEFRRMVVSGRVATSPKPSPEAWAQLRLRYRLAAMTADVWHSAGFTVVVQDVVVGPILAEQRGGDHVTSALSHRPGAAAERGNACRWRRMRTDGDVRRQLRIRRSAPSGASARMLAPPRRAVRMCPSLLPTPSALRRRPKQPA